MSPGPAVAVVTAGHGRLDADELAGLLQRAGVRVVADVRRFPGSRRHPQFAREAMARWLPAAGIAYEWLPELGGRRSGSPASPNTALREPPLRAYADHMATEEFARGIGRLRWLAEQAAAGGGAVAVLCAESVWWRCHRRLLADHLVLVERVPVTHLFHDGRLAAHDPMPEARPTGGHLTYPEPTLWPDPGPGAQPGAGRDPGGTGTTGPARGHPVV